MDDLTQDREIEQAMFGWSDFEENIFMLVDEAKRNPVRALRQIFLLG